MSLLSKEKDEDEPLPEYEESSESSLSSEDTEGSSDCCLFEAVSLELPALDSEESRFFFAPFRLALSSLSSLLDEDADNEEEDDADEDKEEEDEGGFGVEGAFFLLEVGGDGVRLDRLSARARALCAPASFASTPDIDDFLGGGEGNSIVTSFRQ
jgi:hypothetical protein